MADFCTRLVSRTLSGLEPTVQPLIAPMYASEITMADNYAVDTAPELGLSVSQEYASTESPIEQSPELLGISATETINLASNINRINWREIQLPNNPSEITSSEQLQPDRAIDSKPTINRSLPDVSSSLIASEPLINSSSTGESSLPIAPSIKPATKIQKLSISDVKPASELGIERSPLSNALTTQSSRLVESQVTDVNNNYSLGNTSTLSCPVGKPLNNKSDPARSRKVSLPLVQSEVIAPLSSFSPNSLGRLGPPVNKIESIPSKETEVFFESNVPAISNSFPQTDLSNKAPSSLSYPSPQPQSQRNKIESNFSSHSNSFNSSEEKELVNRDGDFFEIAKSRLNQTNTIPFKIEPRLDAIRQELPQSSEQISELPLGSNSQSPSQELSQTGLQIGSGSPRKITNINAESTPTINITIGRVEVRGVKPPEPPPMTKSRSKTPQLSLSDYLKQRGGK
ncbi:MAG: hypothetical protein QNJ18_05370 [Xenococcaceae cyanobacterium MO_167.B52]|nr:hypothetical protein [Xenococcaceae cyanobacterium MO_167.B52]